MGKIKTVIEDKLQWTLEKPFAVFDFDNTCIVNDIAEATLLYVCRNKLFKDNSLAVNADGNYHENVFRQYSQLLRQDRVKDAYMLTAQILSGFTPAEIESLALDTLKAEENKIGTQKLYGLTVAKGLAARPQVKELVEFLISKGVDVWVVSASPEPLVRVAMNYFGISGNLIGIRNEMRNGVFTKEILKPLSILEEKVDCIKVFINPDQKPLLVVGDSMNDFAMLKYADVKVVINRNNQLVKEACKRGWFILDSK